jgi:hypothetical protein
VFYHWAISPVFHWGILDTYIHHSYWYRIVYSEPQIWDFSVRVDAYIYCKHLKWL